MKLTSEQEERVVNRLKNEEPIQYRDSFFRDWDHEKVRKLFVFATWKYLRNLYSKYLKLVHEGKERLFDVPNDPNEYSMLNYLASNHSAFAAIVNYFNQEIVNNAKKGNLIATRQLEFDEYGINWELEIQAFLEIYRRHYKEVLTQQDNGVFDKIVEIIERTNKKGYLSEEEMLRFLKKVFPLAKDFKTGGHGKTSDLEGGVDIQFYWRGKTRTLQQKSCSYIYRGRRNYYVNGVSGIKYYDTTYYGFQTANNRLYIFENDSSIKIREFDGNKKYEIPHRLLRYETKI